MASRFGDTAKGALSGAATGASIGSFVPGIGTAIGAGAGGIIGGLGGFFSNQSNNLENKQYKKGLAQIFGNLNEMSAPEGSYSRAQNYLSSILEGGPEGYNKFAAPYLQQFEQQLLPQIAERFGGLGGGLGGGVRSSSGFGQALGGASSNLQAQLAQLYQQQQSQASGQAFNQYNNLANLGLGQPQAQEGSFSDEILSSLSEVFGQEGGRRLAQYLSSIGSQKPEMATGPYGDGASYDPYSGYQGSEFLG